MGRDEGQRRERICYLYVAISPSERSTARESLVQTPGMSGYHSCTTLAGLALLTK